MVRHCRLSGMVAVVIAACSLGVTSAAAGAADLRSPDAVDAAAGAIAAVAPARIDLRSPDAQDLGRGVPSSAPALIDARSPDSIDRAAGGVRPTAAVQIVPAGSSSGFDWGDAGIGAGSVAALVLLALGGGLMVMHRRHLHEAAKAPTAAAS
jgi:hypothetical protein